MCKDTKQKEYTIAQFRADYPNDDACLDKLFNKQFGHLQSCPECGKKARFKRVKGRKSYYCPSCLLQLYPMANTIFEKSTTPLTVWFYAFFLFAKSKNGVSAYELQRQTGVSYKTAWRMGHQIRSLLTADESYLFSGDVECDETFVGGKNINRHSDKKVEKCQGRSFKDKTPVFGMYERKTGLVYTQVVDDTKARSIVPLIHSKVASDSTIMSDEWSAYNSISKTYKHEVVFHAKGEYSTGNVTTNRIENFWSVFKRTIKGTHIHVSPKYLQAYANEVTFKFNHRSDKQLFQIMTDLICAA